MNAEIRPDPVRAAALGASLREAGFDAAALASLQRPGITVPPAVRLFVLGEPVASSELAPLLDVDSALAVGVATREGDHVLAAVRIVPHDVLLLASDLPTPDPEPDHVAAAHPPSLLLARLTIRRPVQRALDLGTGNGIQALMLALHADHVVATDVNPRALRFTELNAALNGRTNIETREASFFDSFPDERFGVVVCSPPYVISPDSRFLYRDAALRGDRVGEHLARAIPALLEPDGFATLLASWVDDEDPLDWAPEVSALVIRVRRESARASADYWLEGEHADDHDRWLAYYEDEGIAEINYGALVLHHGQTAWHETLELPGGPVGHAGSQLEVLFTEHEESGEIRGCSFAWAPATERTPVDGGVELTVPGGLGLRARIPAKLAVTAERLGAGHPATAADAELARHLLALGALVRSPRH